MNDIPKIIIVDDGGISADLAQELKRQAGDTPLVFKTEEELRAEVFDPRVSDREYFERRARHYGILPTLALMSALTPLGQSMLAREAPIPEPRHDKHAAERMASSAAKRERQAKRTPPRNRK